MFFNWFFEFLYFFLSPCIQSPLKQKVEAFEKHAHDMQSPGTEIPQRQTRIKTRTNAAKENLTGSAKIKPATPLLESRIAKPCTPLGQSISAASFLNQNSKRIVSSATKPGQLARAGSTNNLPHSKDNSAAADLKRATQVFFCGYNRNVKILICLLLFFLLRLQLKRRKKNVMTN